MQVREVEERIEIPIAVQKIVSFRQRGDLRQRSDVGLCASVPQTYYV
jgi:hypothetical protein